jgi:hypothetical protein
MLIEPPLSARREVNKAALPLTSPLAPPDRPSLLQGRHPSQVSAMLCALAEACDRVRDVRLFERSNLLRGKLHRHCREGIVEML